MDISRSPRHPFSLRIHHWCSRRPIPRSLRYGQALAAAAAVLLAWWAPAVAAADQQAALPPLGVCWGRVSHRPIPVQAVVAMFKEAGIMRVKLFDTNGEVLGALANSDADVMVMVRNQDLQGIATDDRLADQWVYNNLIRRLPSGVNIRSVSVGNEPYLTTKRAFDNYLVLACHRLYAALKRADLHERIKLTVSFNSEILSDSFPPSAGRFTSAWVDEITNITALIASTGSFFSINIYPFFSFRSDPNIPMGYVMFNATDKETVMDNGTRIAYRNMVDAGYDAVVSALTKIGFPDVELVIGEIGWPSDGHPNATLALASAFNRGAVRHLMSGKGTPLRPNRNITFYLFGLLDEDAKGLAPGAFERRWGLYDEFGRPKFLLDLSGQGGEPSGVTLPPFHGLKYLPQRWCVVESGLELASSSTSPSATSSEAVVELQDALSRICGTAETQSYDRGDLADCTPVTSVLNSPGLRCAAGASSLAFNVSYALNAYYQASGQSEAVCVGDGIGQVTTTDPSSSVCTFDVGIDVEATAEYFQPSSQWSWAVMGYIVALVVILSTFL